MRSTWVKVFWALLLSASAVVLSTARLQAHTDSDGDGVSDADEQYLAETFMPTVHFSAGEPCDWPTPRKVIYRVRHPSFNSVVREDYILINYVQLYDVDCGIYGTGHDGDDEPFEVWLKWSGSAWVFDSVSATAHWDATCEDWTASYSPNIWIGNSKHGTYANPYDCGCAGQDDCDVGGDTGYSFDLYNVGEPGAHMINDLYAVYSSWSGQYVWGSAKFYDAGYIIDELFNDRFKVITVAQPEYDDCLAGYCSDSVVGGGRCESPSDPEIIDWCEANIAACVNSCFEYAASWDY